MKKWMQALRMDFFRCFRSPLFMLTVLAIAGIKLLGVVQEIRIVGEVNVLYLHHIQEFGVVVTFLGPLPFSTAFCVDYQNHFAPYSMQRSSVSGYAWAKMTCAALCSALATALGIGLFYAVLALRFPLMETDSIFEALSSIPPYGQVLLGAHPSLYLVYQTLSGALLSAVLASAAMAISCFIPNLFVALSSPILLYYVAINTLTNGPLSLYRVFVTTSVDMGGSGQSLLYAFGYAVAWLGLFGGIFLAGVKRRVEHG